MRPEILAPAGGKEQLIAAVRSGADAVYLGADSFNARRNAENFKGIALKEAVSYCHARGVKVHVTANTLIKDNELSLFYQEMQQICESGADAVLVQDLGAAALFKKHCPSMPLHASTQMTVHNLEGVFAAAELGFSRVVLARELSLKEITYICKQSPIEIEVFVHGALCMCVSGQCMMSSMLGERSGNRGLCAQPCRLNFRSGTREYALSLKDMSHISHLSELVEAGVDSLKIEGRMKRPEYVSAAVIACRTALEGESPDLTKLKAVFSRSGFTDGYLTGRRDLDMFGIRTIEDAKASSGVLGELASGYRNEYRRIPVDMQLLIQAEQPAKLIVSDGEYTVTVTGAYPEQARTKETTYETAEESLSKTGGTPFYLQTLTTKLDTGYMLPQGQINKLRKEALDLLLTQRSQNKPKEFIHGEIVQSRHKTEQRHGYRLRFESKEQIVSDWEKADFLSLPVHEIDDETIKKYGDKLIGELPRLVFPLDEEKLAASLADLKTMGLKRVLAGNIGTIRMAKEFGFLVHGNFDLNILNTQSLMLYESMGLEDTLLSLEIRLRDAAGMGGEIQRGIIGYGYSPLMLVRNCPIKGAGGCGTCQGYGYITDRFNTDFTVYCHQKKYSSILNSLPVYLGDKTRNTDFTVLYFTLETKKECQDVWDRYQKERTYDGSYTRGLYYRTLL